MRRYSLVFVTAVLAAAPAFAAFAPPAYATLPNPLAAATTQLSTYQSWNVFGSAKGPNTADVYNVNPYGAANVFDSSSVPASPSGVFVTSGGNIYSPTGVIKPRVTVPLANVAGNTENVVVELQVGIGSNTLLAPESLFVNEALASTLGDYSFTPNLANGIQQYTYTFTLPDTATLRLDWDWDVTSASIDRLAVSTVSVPEPASLAILGAGAASLMRRRRV